MRKPTLMLTVVAALVTSSLVAAPARAADDDDVDAVAFSEPIPIWLAGTPGVFPEIEEKSRDGKRFFHIHNPTLTVCRPAKPNGVAIVLCPGGGYGIVATGIEGTPVAPKLTAAGITVFMLKYRLPTTRENFKHPVPMADALRAIQFVRHHAKEYGVDPEKVGIMGFSAGGHLAATAGTLYHEYQPLDDTVGKTDCRPDFMCLVYPVITTQAEGYVHGCVRALLAKDAPAEQLAHLSCETNVTDMTPPAFLVHATADGGVKYQNSVLMYDALKKHGVDAKLKLYEKGGHGFGPGRPGDDSAAWTSDFITWLRGMKIIPMEE